MLVWEPAPASLHLVTVDGLINESGAELQGLLAVAVHWSEAGADDAVEWVRELLESPVGQVPGKGHTPQICANKHNAMRMCSKVFCHLTHGTFVCSGPVQ